MYKLGKAFEDNITKEERKRYAQSIDEDITSSKWLFLLSKINIFYFLLIIIFWILILRVIQVTVIQGSYYKDLADGNRMRQVKIIAPRGILFDRLGNVLVKNYPVYKIQKDNGDFQQITNEELFKLESSGSLTDYQLIEDVRRLYLHALAFAHVIGYTNEATNEEVKSGKYGIGDRVGRIGIEEAFDQRLRGINGKELFETDALGRRTRILGKVDAKPGNNLKLALDVGLQNAAQASFSGKFKGAVIASNPYTGEIMALYSSPSFDPNKFSFNISLDDYNKLLTDEEKPLFNRAISGLYPPGSTFKIITAAAGLQLGEIDENTKIEDTGIIQIGPYRFPNWYYTQYGKTEGEINVVSALTRSNDIFFYKVGEMVGISQLSFWAYQFNTGKKLGIDIAGEEAGIVPNAGWKLSQKDEDWFLGDTYHVAIGQGYLLVTPLQVNFWTAAIANGGWLCKPKLLKSEQNIDFKKKECKNIGLSENTIWLITQGLHGACSPGGTGFPLFNFQVKGEKIETACKTGTAEFGDPKDRTHAWFTVFAPLENPQIVVTVFVEEGGEGSYIAAPIAKAILTKWFAR